MPEAPVPSRSKPRRANLADAIVKALSLAQHHKGVPDRLYEVIALSLERDGDVAGAAAVRAHREELKTSGARGVVMRLMPAPDTDTIRWLEPTDVSSEIVPYGDASRMIAAFADDAALAADFAAAGVDPIARAIFSGPSGTGKTLSVRWLGWRVGLPVAAIDLARIVKSHLGETGSNIMKSFAEATRVPSILFLDEIDGFSSQRNGDGEHEVAEMKRVTTVLLQQLDWLPPSQIVVAATNVVDRVDPALHRRFPYRVTFDCPNEQARMTMVERWLARAPVDRGEIASLVVDTDGVAPAELRARAMELGRNAVRSGRPPRTLAP